MFPPAASNSCIWSCIRTGLYRLPPSRTIVKAIEWMDQQTAAGRRRSTSTSTSIPHRDRSFLLIATLIIGAAIIICYSMISLTTYVLHPLIAVDLTRTLDAYRYTPAYATPMDLRGIVTIHDRPELSCTNCFIPFNQTEPFRLYAHNHDRSTVSDQWDQWLTKQSRDLTWPGQPFASAYYLSFHDHPIWVDGAGRFGSTQGSSSWVLPGGCRWWDGPDNTWWLLRPYNRIIRPTIPNAILLAQPWGSHAYHFLLEVLPRLALVPQSIRESMDYKVIIQDLKYPLQQRELLNWVGLGNDDRLIYLPGEHYTAVITDHLIIPQPCACSSCNPRVLQSFRNLLFTTSWLQELTSWSIPHHPTERKNILWIRRKGSRSVTNDASLLTLAEEVWPSATFHFLTPDTSMKDTARMFHLCDTIIGPHGAAWSNIIFARPGYTAIEFIPEGDPNHMYIVLSAIFQARKHSYVLVPNASHTSDMTVPLAAFKDTIMDKS